MAEDKLGLDALLRDIAEGRALGDTTTLADPAVVQSLQDRYEEGGA
jgi:acetyl-CoA synthetase